MNWYDKIKVGDEIIVRNLWNKTSPKNKQITSPVEVIGVDRERNCDCGVMFKVKYDSGGSVKLSAGWFKEPK